MQPHTRILCMPKSHTCKHDIPSPIYKGLKKKFHSTNNVEHKFWFCHDDIKRCMSVNKIKLFWTAYSAQHVASEDRNQSNQGRGVGAWRCQVSIAIEGGIFTASLAFGNCNTPNLSVAFMCVSIFQMSTQRSYSWSQAVAIQHHKQRFTKANGRTPDPWMETMLLSHYHSTSTIYCYYQHCLQGG